MADQFEVSQARYRLKPVVFADMLRIARRRDLPVAIGIKGGWIKEGKVKSTRRIKRNVGVVHLKQTGIPGALSERHSFIRVEDIATIEVLCAPGQLDDVT